MFLFNPFKSAGKHIRYGKIPKIVGLDPANPLFKHEDQHTRLDAADAEYVEIIHSNAGRLGFFEPIGTANFYPNGGRVQPGCAWDISGTCSHSRSYEFFAESLHSNVPFFSYECSSIEEISKGNCSVVDTDGALMGGEPGNKKFVNQITFVLFLYFNGISFCLFSIVASKEFSSWKQAKRDHLLWDDQ